jgi:hypothetical protein
MATTNFNKLTGPYQEEKKKDEALAGRTNKVLLKD